MGKLGSVTIPELLTMLRNQPLVVSVQASEGSATDHTETLLRMAQASVAQGVRVLRLEGAERVRLIRADTQAVTIGLIKRSYPESAAYITPTEREVDELLQTGCEIVALDATVANAAAPALIQRVKSAGRLAMADCDTVEAALRAVDLGADLVGTTLSGYTQNSCEQTGPDLALVRQILRRTRTPVLAEGRYSQRWQVDAALRIGAAGVVVGGAINDTVKTTKSLQPPPRANGPVGAFDIGGTWIRFGVFSPDWDLLEVVREPLPPDRKGREAWISEQLLSSGVVACGVSTGGTVDPATGEVWEAKSIIPDYVGARFDFDVPTAALNDGLATAWGHACLPDFAGRRVATLALGTGVGCGFVAKGRIWHGPRGEYPRINDLPTARGTIEELLGGAALSPHPDEARREGAVAALRAAVQVLRGAMMPEEIVVCGAVGLSSWMQPVLAELGLRTSPFGADAGLFGAAALALYPPAPG